MANTIRYAAGQSSLGPFVAALSDRGLAMVAFGAANEADLKARFTNADLVEDPAMLQETLGKLAGLIDHPETSAEFALDLQGSPFELKVWQALREIPDLRLSLGRQAQARPARARTQGAPLAAVGCGPT